MDENWQEIEIQFLGNFWALCPTRFYRGPAFQADIGTGIALMLGHPYDAASWIRVHLWRNGTQKNDPSSTLRKTTGGGINDCDPEMSRIAATPIWSRDIKGGQRCLSPVCKAVVDPPDAATVKNGAPEVAYHCYACDADRAVLIHTLAESECSAVAMRWLRALVDPMPGRPTKPKLNEKRQPINNRPMRSRFHLLRIDSFRRSHVSAAARLVSCGQVYRRSTDRCFRSRARDEELRLRTITC